MVKEALFELLSQNHYLIRRIIMEGFFKVLFTLPEPVDLLVTIFINYSNGLDSLTQIDFLNKSIASFAVEY